MFRFLVENTDDVVYVAGLDGRIRYISPAVEWVLGYRPDELIGTTGMHLVDPADQDSARASFAESLRRPEATRAQELRVRHRDGSWRTLEVVRRIVRDPSGIPSCVVNSRDITARKRGEDALRFLADAGQTLALSLDAEVTLRAIGRLVVPHLADSCIVYLLDGDGHVRRLEATHAEPEMEARLRERVARFPLTLDRLIRPVAEALQTGQTVLRSEIDPADLTASGWTTDAPERNAVVPHALMVIPLLGRGRILGAISLGATAPGRAFRTDDLVLAEDLAQRAALAIDNARLYTESRTAAAARSRFYAMISHDLRAPLGAIMLYNDVLLSGVEGALTPSQQEGLELSQRSARHLSELVDDLLDLSKVQAGKMECRFEPVRIAELVDDLLATLGPVAAEAGSELRVEHDPAVPQLLTDPRRLRQILLNLTSNALKFGAGKPVRVSSTIDADEVRIEIRDGGPGIAADDLPRIWDEFVQLKGGPSSGTGLGLAIARRFAELLGGRVEAESEPGSGSTFRVVLPLGSAGTLEP